ncbi:MAG: NHLP-related RiPP peptide [Xanthomonadales bacterium]|nr:NHLP-related RiPP peptide [Xanthomonadales bacterium]
MDATAFTDLPAAWAADGATSDPLAPTTAAGAISPAQGLVLMARLADDDAFRARYEVDPRACLREIGVSETTLHSLRMICFWPRALAPKAAFQALLDDVEGQAFAQALEFRVPKVG